MSDSKALQWWSEVKKRENIDTQEKMYKIKAKDILKWGGERFMRDRYYGSLAGLLEVIEPDYTWYPWKFGWVPHDFKWNNRENHQWWFDVTCDENDITCIEKVYDKFIVKFVVDNGGQRVMAHYGSVQDMVSELIKKKGWVLEPWKLRNVKNGYWKQVDNQKLWIESIMRETGVTDIYEVWCPDWIAENHGGGLLERQYKGDCYKLFDTLFPELDADYWLFKKLRAKQDTNNEHCKSIESQQRWWKYFEEQCGYPASTNEWLDILDKELIYEHGGGSILKHVYGSSIRSMCKTLCPKYAWPCRNTMERKCMETIANDIPDLVYGSFGEQHTIKHNDKLSGYYRGGNFKLQNIRDSFKVDGYSPKHRLIVEVNGDYFHGNPSVYHEPTKLINDRYARELLLASVSKEIKCRQMGYKFVCIWENEYKQWEKENTLEKNLKAILNKELLGKPICFKSGN